jgi:GDP-4-dehydro-6-deoxy-D-mannose reductase
VAARRIFITGASGFVGGHLLPILRERLPRAELFPGAVDVTDAKAVEDEIASVRPDGCVHLAAIAAVRNAGQDPDRAWAVNLHGTLNVARAIMTYVPRCVLIFASSADAYGASFRSRQPLDETAPLAPMNAYGATKAAADLALGAMASEGLRAFRVRPFTHIGPGQTEDFVVAAFAKQVARIAAGLQEPVLRVGTLDTRRDFLDVRDVCAGYAACVARADELEPGAIINLASGIPRRVGDVLQMLCKQANVAPRVETDPARLRASEIALTCGDASRARDLLDWKPQIPWEETLESISTDWQNRVRSEPYVPKSPEDTK